MAAVEYNQDIGFGVAEVGFGVVPDNVVKLVSLIIGAAASTFRLALVKGLQMIRDRSKLGLPKKL